MKEKIISLLCYELPDWVAVAVNVFLFVVFSVSFLIACNDRFYVFLCVSFFTCAIFNDTPISRLALLFMSFIGCMYIGVKL